ncbi:MAG: RNA-guided endonuclease InsQ/TnpB family protein [Shewanella sp.]
MRSVRIGCFSKLSNSGIKTPPICNWRKDDLHKYSCQLVDSNAAIFVDNVNSLAMTKTKLAKSVLDAGWGMLKTMQEYKCAHAGVVFEEINESYTSQTCSCCGSILARSPKGRAGLRIREWSCSGSCVMHDREINAAKNILAVGHGRLDVGIHLL